MEPGHCSKFPWGILLLQVNEFTRIHMITRVKLQIKRTKSNSGDILSFSSKRIHAEPAKFLT